MQQKHGPSPPTLPQMVSRMNQFHAAVLTETATGQVNASMRGSDSRAMLRAKATLFRWGCLANGARRVDPATLRTRYEQILTERGIALRNFIAQKG